MVTPLLRPKNRSLLTRLSEVWQLIDKLMIGSRGDYLNPNNMPKPNNHSKTKA